MKTSERVKKKKEKSLSHNLVYLITDLFRLYARRVQCVVGLRWVTAFGDTPLPSLLGALSSLQAYLQAPLPGIGVTDDAVT